MSTRLITSICCGWTLVFVSLLFFAQQIEPRDIAKPCRQHGGVRQYVSPSYPTQWHPLKGIVVCRDGKVSEVSR